MVSVITTIKKETEKLKWMFILAYWHTVTTLKILEMLI